jgi:hypothetical protein
MILTFSSRQDLFDIVEAANQTVPKIESFRSKRFRWAWFPSVDRLNPRAEHLVQHCLKGGAPLKTLAFQLCGNIVIKSDRRSHDVMLPQRCFDATELM